MLEKKASNYLYMQPTFCGEISLLYLSCKSEERNLLKNAKNI